MKSVMVFGGARGIGAGIVSEFVRNNDIERIYVVDMAEPIIESNKIIYYNKNLVVDSLTFIDNIKEIDGLYITIGIGRVASFDMLDEVEIKQNFTVNVEKIIEIIKKYYPIINSEKNIDVAVMCSIAGRIVSPLFSLYSATKAALSKFIQAINVELAMNNKNNRVLEVSPGKIEGTSFYGAATDVSKSQELVKNIIMRAKQKELLYIPQYEEVYKRVIERNNQDEFDFGKNSFQYKLPRVEKQRKYKIGYLSGTFDLFHVGHLNLLKKAKRYCDFLIVGVHKDGSHKGKTVIIDYEDRVSILEACRYVDKVVPSTKEDSDAWELYHYDYLFVGSDYKGTERFNRYEEIFKNKNVKIVYFPYTQSVSSTKLREKINNKKNGETNE